MVAYEVTNTSDLEIVVCANNNTYEYERTRVTDDSKYIYIINQRSALELIKAIEAVEDNGMKSKHLRFVQKL